MKIRLACPEDAPKLVAIYDQYMATAITFEYATPSPAAFAERIAHIQADYPYLVAEERERLIGYAYAHPLMTRPAYQWSAELSIYFDPRDTGHGRGGKLYEALIDLLRLQGIRTVYGYVTSANEPSRRFHTRMGFQRAGTLHNVGYKKDRWWDVSIYERTVAPYDPSPTLWTPFRALALDQIEKTLATHNNA